MTTRDDQIIGAHAQITSLNTRTWAGLTDILEKLYDQAGDQALYESEERRLRKTLTNAIMASGGPKEVGERAGVSEDTVKSWAVQPFEMTLSDLRRLQLATGLSIDFHVVHPTELDNQEK